MRLFICTEKSDAVLVDGLTDILDGYRMTIDVDRIIGRRDSRPYLQSAIQDSDAFVYALTPNTVTNRRCLWEFEQAVTNHRPVVVAILDSVDPIPEVLRQHIVIDMREDESEEQLLDALYVVGATPPSLLVQLLRNRLMLAIVTLLGLLIALSVAGPYSPFREQVNETVRGVIAVADRADPLRAIPTARDPNDDPALRPLIAMTREAGAESLFLAGQERARAGDYNAAIELFNQTLAIVPGSVGGHIARGRALVAIGESDTAWGDFTQAIELAPGLSLPYLSRAEFYIAVGEWGGALADIQAALMIDADNPEAYNLRGEAHFIAGQYDQALTAFNRALALQANYAEAYSNRGEVYRYTDRPKLAQADFEQAIALNPSLAVAYARRGELRRSSGNWVGARDDFDRAIAIDADHPEARYGRALVNVHDGDYRSAVADFTRAIQQQPTNLALYLLRGSAYRCDNEPTLATADFTLAAQRDLDAAIRYLRQGDSYYCANDLSRVIDPQRIGVTDPNLNGVYQYITEQLAARAATRDASGDLEGAVSDYATAITMTPSYTEVAALYYARGQMFEARGDLQQARLDYEAAIDILPERSDFYVDLGRIMAQQGETDDAFKQFSRALELNPISIYGYLAQGDLYLQLGNDEAALNAYTRASYIDKDNVDALTRRVRLLVPRGDCKLAAVDMDILREAAEDADMLSDVEVLFAAECGVDAQEG